MGCRGKGRDGARSVPRASGRIVVGDAAPEMENMEEQGRRVWGNRAMSWDSVSERGLATLVQGGAQEQVAAQAGVQGQMEETCVVGG